MKQQAGQNVIKKNLVIQKGIHKKTIKWQIKMLSLNTKKQKNSTATNLHRFLEQSGMTETSLKEQIRASLAVKKAIGATITEKELKSTV
ncbi:hypothetical protein GCM10020331_081110 [Ectobacillus funiculus]